MNEYNNNGEQYAKTSQKGKFGRWLENYIYHYKWHTIIALFLVVTIVICSFQMCEKESYDIYLIYAGGKEISKTAKNGDVPEYITFSKSLGRAAEDYNGDGKVTVTLDTLFLLTADEIKAKNDELKESGSDERVNELMISENAETLSSRMIFSEYYACLLSEEIYKTYTQKKGFMFTDLAPFVEEGTEIKYFDDTHTAIYLNSTNISSLPVLCDLPDDTLIVLRALSEVSNTLNEDDNKENYRRSQEFIKKMINY